MPKRVPQVNESAQALHTDTSGKLSASQEKGLRPKEANSSGNGDLVPPIPPNPTPGQAKDNQPESLFERLKSRITGHANKKVKKNPDEEYAQNFLHTETKESHEHYYEDAPRKGDLAAALRLEVGKDKLLVNQGKLTSKIRKMLVAIEAQDTYLKNIALKIVAKKHQGVVIDLPKKEDALNSTQTEQLAKILASKKESKDD